MALAQLRWLSTAACALCAASLAAGETHPANVELLARGKIAGDAGDLSVSSHRLETGTPANQLGGFSAIDYSGDGDTYWVLSDRGPGDGAASYACRMQKIELSWHRADGRLLPKLVETILLRNEGNQNLLGSLSALSHRGEDGLPLALDSEGLRVLNQKALIISDEYGPSVSSFDLRGERTGTYVLPKGFSLCEAPSQVSATGTYPNRGLEGLAITPNGSTLIAAMQGPLVQDGRLEGDKCLGLHTRWVRWDLTADTGTSQLLYVLADESSGVSEILAVDEHRYLVLERDSQAGSEARFKRVYLVDTSMASDISQVDNLNQSLQAGAIRPVTKDLLIDMLDPRFGIGGELTPEKPEGLSWGPALPDGRRTLIICTDNDFETARDSEFYLFAIRI
jgi:hypothetical protein